jgi:hypothetical protein
MTESKVLATQEADGSASSIRIEITTGETCRINFDSKSFEGSDLFAALTALRVRLESANRRIACNGARPDVFPSGMAREMSKGRKAYILRIGDRPKREDLVDIFEPADFSQLGSVDDQQAFVNLWKKSI